MTIAPLAFTAERATVMDFSYDFHSEMSAVVMKRIDPQERKWRTMIDPLTWPVYLCIFASIPGVAMVLTFIAQFDMNQREQKPGNDVDDLRRMRGSLWYLIGSLFMQGQSN